MFFVKAGKTHGYCQINESDNGQSGTYKALFRMLTVAVENDLSLWIIAFEILIKIDLSNFLARALYIKSHPGIT